jgi:hypothetical protein
MLTSRTLRWLKLPLLFRGGFTGMCQRQDAGDDYKDHKLPEHIVPPTYKKAHRS